MVIDYSERRQSRRMEPRRPQRPSVWPYAILIVVMIAFAYVGGVGTGWYLFRPGGKYCPVPPAVQPQAAKSTAPKQATQAASPVPQAQTDGLQPMPQQPLNSLPPTEKGNSPVPLTFYNTLQKGNKELMGTGINQPKEGQGGAAKPAPAGHPEH